MEDDLLRDPRWFLEDYRAEQNAFALVATDRASLASQPFLDQRWNRSALRHVQAPITGIEQRIPVSEALPGLNFIWHTSLCCSTIIAESLDCPGHNLALREPFVLVSVADARRAHGHRGRAMPARLPELTFRLLAKPEAEGAQVTVKPSNFANILAQDAARQTAGQALFLYSSLERFLLAIAKGGFQTGKYARRLFANIAGDSGQPLPWPPATVFEMSDLEIAALAWHLQIAEFQRSISAYGSSRAASLDCEDFLHAPLETLEKINALLALGLPRDRLEVAAQRLPTRDAKRVGVDYDAAARNESNQRTKQLFGNDLAEIVAWSYRACPGTPRGALANAL